MALTYDDLNKVVGAIRSEFEPTAIILFGSHARGEATASSDVDLLVIRKTRVQPGESRRLELGRLYRTVAEVCSIPTDILLFTKAEYDAWKGTTNHMLAAAAREGLVLYGEV